MTIIVLTNLEGDIGHGGDGEQVLHAVDDGVGHGGHGGVANGEADRGHVGDTSHEPVLEVIVGDVKDLGIEHGARVVHLIKNMTSKHKYIKLRAQTNNNFKQSNITYRSGQLILAYRN